MISHVFSAIKEFRYSIQTSSKFFEEDFSISGIVGDHLSSSCLIKQREGLKKIICMMQRNKDCSEYYVHVLRISDTRDPFLKRMTSYYLHSSYSIDVNLSRFTNRSNSYHVEENRHDGGAPVGRTIADASGQTLIFGRSMVAKHNKAERILDQCTNTLLKDLDDKNADLRNSALEFLIKANESEFFPSFSRRIRNIMHTEVPENKARAILLLERLSVMDYKFLENNDLIADILNTIRLGSLQLQVCALKCINTSSIAFIKKEELVRFLTKITSARGHEMYYSGIEVITRIIAENREVFSDEQMRSIMKKLKELLSTDLYTAFCAADAILKIDVSLQQYVFDKMCFFLYHKDEDLLHLLAFLLGIIQENSAINYNNRLFAIFNSEKDYVKKAKFDILSHNPDSFAINEILNLSRDPRFRIEALVFCFENEIANVSLFKDCLNVQREYVEGLLYYYRPASDSWRDVIDSEYRLENLTKESMFVGSYYLSSIPEYIDLGCADKRELLKFYTSFYIRNIVEKAELKTFLERRSFGDAVAKAESAILLYMLENNDIGALKEYSNVRLGFIVRIKSQGYKYKKRTCLGLGESISIEKLRPFELESKIVLDSPEKGTVGDKVEALPDKAMPGFSCTNRKDTTPSMNSTPGNREDDLIRSSYCFIGEPPANKRMEGVEKKHICIKKITNIWFTGKVLLRDCDIVLKIESMTRPFKVSTKNLSVDKEMLISDISEHKVGEISLPQPFSLKINDLYGYSVNLNCRICIVPFICDPVSFNDMFNKVDACVTLPKVFTLNSNIHVLDRSSFAFEMMGDLFFGKIMSDGIVLKSSNNELLAAIFREIK